LLQRINSLLSTSDLDVLVHALTLLLRPAQQYSAQPAVSRALNISTPRLLSIAKRWSHLREYGVNVVDLVSEQGKTQVDSLPPEAREIQFTFYKTGKPDLAKESLSTTKEMDVDAETSEPPKTPVRRNTGGSVSALPSTGAVQIHVDQPTLEEKSTMEILADVLEQHELSGDDKYELMCRIRTAQALLPGREETREKLVVARLTAIAIFVHTHTEQTTTSALFLYEPDLTPHIAELLALDGGVPIAVQTAAIAALDAMARYRSRIQDVLGAVNAGVNHGTLMALLRKTVADVANPDCTAPHTFVDALLSFVTFLASHAAGGTMVVGAGLVPLLIAIIENRLPTRLPMVSKAMQLVDNVLYSFTNAFQLFCTNKGVDVLVERIQWEIDEDIRLFAHEAKDAGEAPRSYGA
jgi:E3 ubiquitin-protein ligase HUWE1